jgi:hypothetical protein
MSARGAIIMGFFGALFAAMTLFWEFHVTGWVLMLPFLGFVIIALAASRIIRLPGEGTSPSEKVRRTMMWSSVAEGIALFLGGNIVINLHRQEWLLPEMALVVGAHFIPIALVASSRTILALGTCMMAAGIIGVLMPAPWGGALAGFSGAAGLWFACALALFRDYAAKHAGKASA